MPLPRLSGLLNNCVLNSALPTLLKNISQLATVKNLDQMKDDLILQQYDRLKALFATYYGINPKVLNWCNFYRFLEIHSFYAWEIIFAPVFRGFIAEQGPACGYDEVLGLRDVQQDGRFNPLTVQEAAELFHQHFGILLDLYIFDKDMKTDNCSDNYRKVTGPTLTIKRSDFFAAPGRVQLYLKNYGFDTVGHFELQPHEVVGESIQIFEAEAQSLPKPLSAIHDGLSISQSAHASNQQLGKLVTYVRQSFSNLLTRDLKEKYMLSAQDYLIYGRSIHNDTSQGNHTFAVILLSILVECGCSDAQTYLDQMAGLGAIVGTHASSTPLLNKLCKEVVRAGGDMENERLRNALAQAETYLIELNRDVNEEVLINEFTLNGWMSIISGLMLSILGFALVIFSAICFSGGLAWATFPAIATGVSSLSAGVGGIYTGIRFFSASVGKREPVELKLTIDEEAPMCV